MRALIVSAYFRPHVGGVERFVESLAGGLVERGHEVTVLCMHTNGDSPFEEKGTYRVRRVPATNVVERRLGVPYPLPSPRALVRELDRELARVDVVHVQDVLYLSSLAALARARRTGKPSLVTLHVGFVPQRNGLLDGAERAAIRAAGPLARAASRLVAYNPDVAAWASATWGVEASVAPVGVEVPRAAPDRERFGLTAGRRVALFVGRDVPKKNLDVFAGAETAGWELVAVTDGSRRGLRTLPFMPVPELASLVASVDALVLPSRGEGLPLIVQEAMTLGVPVVTTMQPGYERYFGADDVVAIEPTSPSVRAALERLSSAEERQRLAARSRAVAAEHFTVAAMADAYERHYEELVSRSSANLRSS